MKRLNIIRVSILSMIITCAVQSLYPMEWFKGKWQAATTRVREVATGRNRDFPQRVMTYKEIKPYRAWRTENDCKWGARGAVFMGAAGSLLEAADAGLDTGAAAARTTREGCETFTGSVRKFAADVAPVAAAAAAFGATVAHVPESKVAHATQRAVQTAQSVSEGADVATDMLTVTAGTAVGGLKATSVLVDAGSRAREDYLADQRGGVRDIIDLSPDGRAAVDRVGHPIAQIDDVVFGRPLPGENFDHVEELNVSGNALAAVPDIRALTGLRTLNLAGNRLSVVPDLRVLASLEVLNLAGNQLLVGLGQLPATLTHLDISNTQIADIGVLINALRGTHIQEINLTATPLLTRQPLVFIYAALRRAFPGVRITPALVVDGRVDLVRVWVPDVQVIIDALRSDPSPIRVIDIRGTRLAERVDFMSGEDQLIGVWRALHAVFPHAEIIPAPGYWDVAVNKPRMWLADLAWRLRGNAGPRFPEPTSVRMPVRPSTPPAPAASAAPAPTQVPAPVPVAEPLSATDTVPVVPVSAPMAPATPPAPAAAAAGPEVQAPQAIRSQDAGPDGAVRWKAVGYSTSGQIAELIDKMGLDTRYIDLSGNAALADVPNDLVGKFVNLIALDVRGTALKSDVVERLLSAAKRNLQYVYADEPVVAALTAVDVAGISELVRVNNWRAARHGHPAWTAITLLS